MNGCLLVHGLTSSPGVMNPVRDALAAEGFHIEMPLLAGHGGTLKDLSESTWQDWYRSLRVAYKKLRHETDKIYYVGLSMGCLLGLKLASEEGWGVRAMSLISPPMRLPFFDRLKYLTVNYTPLRWVIDSVAKDFEGSVAMPEGRAKYRDLALDRMPLGGVRQIVALQKVVRRSLKRVTNPILVVSADKDKVAPPWNARIIKRGVSSDVVDIIRYSRSKHVITLDWDGQDAARRICEFFRRFA